MSDRRIGDNSYIDEGGHPMSPEPDAALVPSADAQPSEPVIAGSPEPFGEADPEPGEPKTFIGPRGNARRRTESVFVRLVATSGIVGISVALAAVLGTQDVAYWIVGLVISLVSVVLAAILWSSRTL